MGQLIQEMDYSNIWYEEIKIPELKKDEVYISHVGDGEYSFNVFGGVYTDSVLMFFSFREKDKKAKIIIAKRKDVEEVKEFYFLKESFKAGFYYEVARFTIERLNPAEFNIGC